MKKCHKLLDRYWGKRFNTFNKSVENYSSFAKIFVETASKLY